MSRTGIPSVMQTTRLTPASAASRIASAANRGGTKIIEVFAPVSRTASTDRVEHRDALDVLPGLARRHAGHDLRAVGAVAQRVERALVAGDALHHELRLARRPARSRGLPAFARSAAVRAASSIVGGRRRSADGPPRSGSRAPPRRSFRPAEPRSARGLDPLQRLQDALRHQVAARDPSEDVDEHRLHGRVGQHDLERGRHLIGAGAAPDVQEVRGLARPPAPPRRASTSPGRRRCR